MLIPKTVYALQCDLCDATIPDPRCGTVGWELPGLLDAAYAENGDWYRDEKGYTYCPQCVRETGADGLTPIGSTPELCVDCGLCHHPFPQTGSHWLHYPNADGCGYCDELNAEGIPLCEDCHRLLATLGYRDSHWYWGDLEFAVDDMVAGILWRAVWSPGHVTVGQAQDAWDYAERTGNTDIMGAAGDEPAVSLPATWDTIGDFLDRDGDAFARFYHTTPVDAAARCLEWHPNIETWRPKRMERRDA